jgi:hypothetical protein
MTNAAPTGQASRAPVPCSTARAKLPIMRANHEIDGGLALILAALTADAFVALS